MKRPLAIVCALLGLVWLIATAVLLFFVAGLVGVPFLLLAFVGMDGAFLLLLAILLVTNTRVAWPAPDPFGQATDDLLRPAVMIGDRPYGRRAADDRNVVARLSDILEDEASRRKPGETPAWVVSMNQRHSAEETDDVPTT